MTILLKKLVEDIFYISLLTYGMYFILELFKEGLVSNYFDLNLLLLWIIIFGIVNMIINNKKVHDKQS